MEQPSLPESPELAMFRAEFTAALTDTVDFLGLDDEPYFLPLRPEDLGVEDPRGFEELSDDERMIIRDVTYNTLGCDDLQPPARIYTVHSEDGEEIQVQVLHTNRSDTGVFLHRFIYSDGSSMFVLAPQDATIIS